MAVANGKLTNFNQLHSKVENLKTKQQTLAKTNGEMYARWTVSTKLPLPSTCLASRPPLALLQTSVMDSLLFCSCFIDLIRVGCTDAPADTLGQRGRRCFPGGSPCLAGQPRSTGALVPRPSRLTVTLPAYLLWAFGSNLTLLSGPGVPGHHESIRCVTLFRNPCSWMRARRCALQMRSCDS